MAKKKNKNSSSSKKRKHVSPLLQGTNSTNENPRKSKAKPKSEQTLQEEAEERRLTALIFGGGEGEENSLDLEEKRVENEDEGGGEESAAFSFQIDRIGATDANKDEDSQDEESPQERNKLRTSKSDSDGDSDGSDSDASDKSAAWVDDDDEALQVDLLKSNRLKKLRNSRSEEAPLTGTDFQKRLRARYKDTMQTTAQTGWAQLDDDEDVAQADEEEDLAVLQSSSQPLLLEGDASSARLPPNLLNIARCPDANQSDYNQAVVQAVHFHPGSDPDRPLLLTAGMDKTLRFFQIGLEKSEKIHGIHFPKLPIHSASFLGTTGKVVVSGRKQFFYIYDSLAGHLDFIPRISGREEQSLEKCFPSPDGKLLAFLGNDGYILLVDVQSKQWIANLKVNGSVRALTFTADGEYILASGSDGDVYRWEVRSRRCVERFSNQDGMITSFLAASSRRHLAVGSESGVINLYRDEVRLRLHRADNSESDSDDDMMSPRNPLKSIMNLSTSADRICFNHDGQVMAMSSQQEKNALKLLHVPTATVFSNWPTSKTPLGYIWSMDFSPQSKFLAMGNDKGKCLLYQLKHYH